ncbi:L-lysine 2,3-aminomutase [Sporomusa silvacetica DSM 10669]|uniref:L-lysine 2,3-aminomutase n=1 Tax=Sporomusa silvacetica DSM 10669 TaxID=1123289 RepID=A0ABZ3IN34_9FIRM|nr:lysine 2,3-aminomutase [Sporomusa silvacetica]OZC18056.1 L-lysine 2,3-aminomutase [Sporomusa silvacetica DSM 10669]
MSKDKPKGMIKDANKLQDATNNAAWSDWHWQFNNRLSGKNDLSARLGIGKKLAEEIKRVAEVFPMAITPYYFSLISKNDPQCPVRLQCVPNFAELNFSPADMEDPLNEDKYSPLPGLIHRYPDRVLLTVTLECASYCRHCSRKRKVGDQAIKITMDGICKGIEYIRDHPQIRDVLLSGGDPLVLGDEILDKIIGEIRAISHVEVIRIGTRVPVVMPQRITMSLVNVLKKYHPLWINTHFNHPVEFTPESEQALAKLADAGIPLGNQTVLLKAINDSVATMKKLLHLLVKNRVRPYYLYHCDYSRGVSHFRTSIREGLEIQQGLIGFTSGFALPLYVMDIPGGGGKVPLGPEYIKKYTDSEIVLRNFEGVDYIIKD